MLISGMLINSLCLFSRVCGNVHGLVRKYNIMCCRQCFRIYSKDIGFIKVYIISLLFSCSSQVFFGAIENCLIFLIHFLCPTYSCFFSFISVCSIGKWWWWKIWIPISKRQFCYFYVVSMFFLRTSISVIFWMNVTAFISKHGTFYELSLDFIFHI